MVLPGEKHNRRRPGIGREHNEIHAGINTGARVAADDGYDIEEIKIQRGREMEAEIEVGMEVAKNLDGGGEQPVKWQEIYPIIYPKPGKGGGMMPGGGGGGDEGRPGQRTGGNGAATGKANGSGDGKKRKYMRMTSVSVFFKRLFGIVRIKTVMKKGDSRMKERVVTAAGRAG